MKKFLAIILTFVLLISALPMTVFAAEAEDAEIGAQSEIAEVSAQEELAESAAEVYVDCDYSFIILDDGTAQITKYAGSEEELIVPAYLGAAIPVTAIGSEAFKDNDDIEKLIFPEGITTIGFMAFYRCDGIEEIYFSSTVTEIGRYAFNGCKSLTAVDIPATVKTIGDYAFASCTNLAVILLHEGLEKLGDHFLARTAVPQVYIPTTVTTAKDAFAQADNLLSVTFGEGVTEIPANMFELCNTLATLTIPATVTRIGNYAFAQMGALEFIVIPDTVTELGEYAFYNCKKLQSVTIGSGLSKLPSYVFASCKSLTQVDVPATVTELGYDVFNNCSALTSVTLHEGLVHFGYNAFARTGITSITIPASVTKGSFPFDGCDNLTTVNFAEGAVTILTGMFYQSGIESIVIPEGVETVSGMAFEYCRNLTDVTFPSTLKTIGNSAFMGCISLEEIDIPANVEEIGSTAFYLDTALSICTLHEGLQKIGDRAFRDTAFTSVYIPLSLTSVSNPFSYSNITDVTFADGITELPRSLFYEAGELTDITIPDTVTKIGDRCFSATNIESIVIPDAVTSLGQYAFADCDNLYAVEIGAGVTSLSYYCFSGCDVLQNVVIPDTVTSLESGVFSDSGLCYQKLPDTITTIPTSAFRNCKDLVEVECSDALTAIGDSAFKGCTSLSTLTTAAEEPSFYANSFENCPRFTDPRFRIFELENTGIEATSTIGTDHTLVHFTVRYDIRDDWKEEVEMSRLILNIPAGFEVIPSSFTAEGFFLDSDAINEAYGENYTPGRDVYIDIQGGQPTAVLRFSAYMNNTGAANKNVTAGVMFRYYRNWFNQSLGEVQFTDSKLSTFAPSTTADESVAVWGYTVTPNKDVTVHIDHLNADGEAASSVSYTLTPNSYTGKYTSEPLNILSEGDFASEEDLFEVWTESDGVRSDPVSFTYLPDAVKVTKAFEVANITKFYTPIGSDKIAAYQNAHDTAVHDITGIFNNGFSPHFIINPYAMYQFCIRLENDENLSEVVLMSHKGDDWKFMQLYYDAATDYWIGEGYFDSNSHEYDYKQYYMPSALNLFYYYGERKDTYRSHYYPALAPSGRGSDLAASGEAFYYDSSGKVHGDVGDPGGTVAGTAGKMFVHGITGKWNQIPSDATVGGLKALWQWGNKNDNLFRTTHHGYAIDDYGNVVFPDDKADMLNRNAENDGRQCNIIDPAGIVYEAVEGNPIAGAVATIEKLNEETGEWFEWNASDFEQENPLMTNSDGSYAWLTDEGRFRVTVSMDGYETQTSEEFDIPPEKLGLNFSLVDSTTHPAMTVTEGEEAGAFTVTFSKFMQPDSVTAETLQIDGLDNLSITPVYLNEGDAYADTFSVTGELKKKELTFTVTDAALSYSGVSAEASSQTVTSENYQVVAYDLWVNGEQVTSEHLTVACGEGEATYDPSEKILTLNNAEITKGIDKDWLYTGILSYIDQLTIEVQGDCTITETGGDGIGSYNSDMIQIGNVYYASPYDITVTGDGTLTIIESTALYGYGIYCTGNLVLDGAKLNITSASTGIWATALAIRDTEADIHCTSRFSGIVVNRGDFTFESSTVNAESDQGAGLLLGSDQESSTMTLSSGTLSLAGKLGVQGIVDKSIVTVNGGTLRVEGSEAAFDESFLADNAKNIVMGEGIGVTDGAPDQTYVVISESSSILLGDADGDGKVSVLDATAIQKKLASIENEVFVEKAADADEDDKITVLDATFIQKWLAHLPSNDNIGKEIA